MIPGAMRGPWTRREKVELALLPPLLVVISALSYGAVAWPLPEAVVGGRSLINSTALLSHALAVVNTQAGTPIGDATTSGANDAAPGSEDPSSCAFLRSASGEFLPRLACGGATDPVSAYSSKPVYLYVWEVPFRVVGSKGAYEGVLSGRAFKATQVPDVEFGDQLWRPDGYDGKVEKGAGGSIKTVFSSAAAADSNRSTFQDLAVLVGVGLVVDAVALRESRRRSGRRLQAAIAGQAWEALGSLAFAPAIAPPRPVLIAPLPAQPAPSATPQPAPAPTPEVRDYITSWEEISGQPGAPPVEETGGQAPSAPSGWGTPQQQPSGKVLVKVLGPGEVEGWAHPPARQKTTELLVYLALHRDRPVSTDKLRTALWPYQPGKPDVSADTVRQELSRLRRCIGAEHFPESKGGGYQLGEGVETDWDLFQALAEAAIALPEEKGTEVLGEALALVRGQPFDGAGKAYSWAFDEVLVAKMEMAVAKAAHQMSARCLSVGRLDDAEWAVRQGLLAGPMDEQVWEDVLAVAAARGGWSSLDQAFKDVERATGPQPAGTPLFEAYRRLRDGR